MTAVVVIDPYDDVQNTAFVNRLHNSDHRRAVVHPPATRDGLVDSVLRALAHAEHGVDAGPPKARRAWAEAWIGSYDRLELIIYGAWRLDTANLRWLTSAATTPTVRVWLIAHDHAANRAELCEIADVVWSWEQFHHYWRTRTRNQRRRVVRRNRRPTTGPPRAIAIAAAPLDPWPWGYARALTQGGSATELLKAAKRISEAATWGAQNVLRLGELLIDLFADWRTPNERAFALMAIKDALFVDAEMWLTWHPDLLRVPVVPRPHPQPTRSWAHPMLAADAVLENIAPRCLDGDEFRIAGDGSHIVLATGKTVAVPGCDRPAMRAGLTFRGKPYARHGGRRQPAMQNDTALLQATADRMLPSLVGLIDLRPLLPRESDEQQELTLGTTNMAWNGLKPAELHYGHGLLLSQLLQRLRSWPHVPSQPLASDDRDDLQALRELYRLGLLSERTRPEPSLAGWLDALWLRRRPVPPPLRPRQVRAQQQAASSSKGTRLPTVTVEAADTPRRAASVR